MRGARTGQADHDHRRRDLHVENLGMAVEHIPDAQAVTGVADAVPEEHETTQPRALGVAVHLGQPPGQAVPEVGGAEIVEARAFDGGAQHRFHRQCHRVSFAVVERGALDVGEPGLAQVGDADRGPRRHPWTEKPPSTGMVCPVM